MVNGYCEMCNLRRDGGSMTGNELTVLIIVGTVLVLMIAYLWLAWNLSDD